MKWYSTCTILLELSTDIFPPVLLPGNRAWNKQIHEASRMISAKPPGLLLSQWQTFLSFTHSFSPLRLSSAHLILTVELPLRWHFLKPLCQISLPKSAHCPTNNSASVQVPTEENSPPNHGRKWCTMSLRPRLLLAKFQLGKTRRLEKKTAEKTETTNKSSPLTVIWIL